MSRIVGTSCRILLLLVVGSLLVLPGLTAEALAQTPSPVAAESEPNNRLSQATLVTVPGQVQGRIDPVRDADWYAFSVPQDGEVQISVPGAAADHATNFAINLEVFNPDAWPLTGWVAPAEKGGDTVATLDLPEGGRYYVEVADDYSDAVSAQPYTLEITFTPAVDAGEPNKRLSTATPLEIGTPRSALVFPIGDADWYGFSVPQDGQVQVTVSGGAAKAATNFVLNLEVFNADAWPLTGWVAPAEPGGDTVAAVDVPEAGRYYLQVVDDYGDARSVQPYTITATFTPGVAP